MAQSSPGRVCHPCHAKFGCLRVVCVPWAVQGISRSQGPPREHMACGALPLLSEGVYSYSHCVAWLSLLLAEGVLLRD